MASLAGGGTGPGLIFKLSKGGKLTVLRMSILRDRVISHLTSRSCQSAKSGKFRITQPLYIILLLWFTTVANAQTLTTLVIFDSTNGGTPYWPLFQGADGNFYGSTGYGGTGFEGTTFKMRPSGTLTTLQSLDYPHLSVQGTDGTYYGTTVSDGPLEAGTVFRVTSSGAMTNLYYFCQQMNCPDGDDPVGGVIQGTDGNFYGTTTGGGANNDGTVFKITPRGELTTLYSFTSVGTVSAALVEGTDGNFYGTSTNGGDSGNGAIFRVTPQGLFTTLHSFNIIDGTSPYDALIQASDGNLYGTTYTGGANDPSDCEGLGCGTVFKMTPEGKLTTLYNFCSQPNCEDGLWPAGSLVEGSDGNLYGTTEGGGAFGETCGFDGNCGTIFKLTPQGKLTTLHSFSGADGSGPYAGLVQGTGGTFYGSTQYEGDPSCGFGGCGTIFSFATGLRPFVEPSRTSGKVGETVYLLGNNLTQATGVSFHGTPATFSAKRTIIRTKVPDGATTGSIVVTTPKGNLQSIVAFHVTQ